MYKRYKMIVAIDKIIQMSTQNIFRTKGESWLQSRRLTEPGLDTVHVVSDIHRLFKQFGKSPHSSADKESASLFSFRESAGHHSIRSHSVKFQMRVGDKSPRASRLPIRRQSSKHIDWSNKSLLSTAV